MRPNIKIYRRVKIKSVNWILTTRAVKLLIKLQKNYKRLLQRSCKGFVRSLKLRLHSLVCGTIEMMHGSEWTLKYDEPVVENVARGRRTNDRAS